MLRTTVLEKSIPKLLRKKRNKPKTPDIDYLINENQFEYAAQLISSFKDGIDANLIFHWIGKKLMSPSWIMFLQNPSLNIFSEVPLSKIRYALQNPKTSNVIRQQLNDFILFLATDEAWCRKLSYPSFINYLEKNDKLFDHMVHSPFLTHLEPINIHKLVGKYPGKKLEILDAIISNLNNEKSKRWAISILKEIIINEFLLSFVIIDVEDYKKISQILLSEFESDRFFAFKVLKIRFLCNSWIKRGFDEAYKHPKLTSKDFINLANHYQKLNNPTLENGYYVLSMNKKPKELFIDEETLNDFKELHLDDIFSPSLIISRELQKTSPRIVNLEEKTDKKSDNHFKPY